MKILTVLMFCATCALPLAALAQAYPSKPIRLVVPNPPGGVDVTLRLVQKDMSEDLGQPIVFDYRPGVNGFIGTEHVARATPDGHTLLASSSASFVVGPTVTRKAPFDSLRDFVPIAALSGGVTVLVVRASLGVSSLKEFVEAARRSPGKLTFGSGGVGTSNHLYAELTNLAAGVTMVHVP
ncbi:MAG: tripartite tricarboxylate transporter substrate binding protein, partial [Betaproteobacteria bacterium]|nr:tripartite tricarboxylate transporter substrate binding protein [Betaproteobacteria bacterium]